MPRLEHARFIDSGDRSYQPGGPVPVMHQIIETRMAGGIGTLPEWTLHVEASSPAHEAMRHMSRIVGFVALAGGVYAIFSVLPHLL